MDLLFSYKESCGVSEKQLDAALLKLAEQQKYLKKVREQGYQEALGFINLPFDTHYQTEIMACVQQKKILNPRAIVLIGIGGSNLGTCAVYEALRGTYYNEVAKPEVPQFYCVDTLDVDRNCYLKIIIERFLQRGESILIISVSKSGTTTETVLNTNYFIDLLKQYCPEKYHEYVVMITDRDSVAWQLAVKEGYAKLAIAENIGGRFSVFSAVGLFPLAMLNVDISALCDGARAITEHCLETYTSDPAISAAILWQQSHMGMTIHDSFFFDCAFETLGKWYRQLMAESLGKEGEGMMPTVSMGTVDLHSMAQLYFGGPHIRITTFYSAVVDTKQNAKMAQVQEVIFKGVQAAYLKAGLPFITFTGLQKTEYAVGYLLQFKMLETVFLGCMMQVNVFDQPQVELYKQEVRRLL